MSGLSHYLQSRTQSIPLNDPTQSNSLQSKTPSTPISESTHQTANNNMQKQQSVMFVLPTETEQQQHSNECRDDCDETASTSSTSTSSRTGRDHGDAIPETSNVYLLHTSNSMIEMKTSSTGAMTYDTSTSNNNSPRRRTHSIPVSPLRTNEHFDYDDDDFIDTGFASHAADACVACSIPVLHFIQFFMC